MTDQSNAVIYEITKLDYISETIPMSFTDPRIWRTGIWQDTFKIASTFPWKPSIKVGPTHRAPVKLCDRTVIEVIDDDCLNAARQQIADGFTPVVLNHSDDKWAGGNVYDGSPAQEESLWRRTNLCETQLQDFYPLKHSPPEGIYTPLATVFKDTESNECNLLDTPWQTAFIAVPGIPYPITKNYRLVDSDVEILKHKIRLILETAAHYNHDSLVLGPLGCGAWKNPAKHVAEIFKEVLAEYDGVFKKITFACLVSPACFVKTHNNYLVFKSIFASDS